MEVEIHPIQQSDPGPFFPGGSRCWVCDTLCDPARHFMTVRDAKGRLTCSLRCLVAEAEAEEREGCAKVVEDAREGDWANVAAAIRARR